MRTRRDARVLVVGMGGLGCPASIAIARAGIGTLGIADDDDVDLSNLHRQILYGESSVGAPKVEEAERALRALSPTMTVQRHTRLLPENARELVASYDLVIEGSDNFATKFLAADACMLQSIPIVQGAAVRWYGTALSVGAHGSPCYRCLFEDVPTGAQEGCNEAGVIGPMVGVVGAVMADLALRSLDGHGHGTLATYDGKTGVLRTRSIARRRSCVLCGDVRTISGIEDCRYVAQLCAPREGTMDTIVRIPAPLRTLTAGKDEVSGSGNTLAELIDDLEKKHPGLRDRLLDDKGVRRFVNIYVGEEDVRFLDGLKTELKAGDQISIVPAIAGGA